MLTIHGTKRNYCDGVTRRDALHIGALAMGGAGMALPGLLRAEAESTPKEVTGKSLINIFLHGGPTHMDTFDLKPEAPKEYRGEFRPIETSVPGVEICELMPELAGVADKYSIIRSTQGMNNEHTTNQSDSGWSVNSLRSIGGRPGVGAVMSKVWGPAQETAHGMAPTAIDFAGSSPGFLGQTYAAYRPDSTGRQNLTLKNVSLERLDDRRVLLSGLDRLKKGIDRRGMFDAVDSYTGRALDLVVSGRIAKALDTGAEDPRTRERYGDNNLLAARRLIEEGVRCVTMTWGGWDTHGNNFNSMRGRLPGLSRKLTALIEDLDARGMLDDTIIMMSGEFGRTPRVNGNKGRDHWPSAAFFFIAGGGFKHGQVIGSTNSRGERPKDNPIRLQRIFHTLYHQLGIDCNTTTLIDPNGRPQFLSYERELIKELV
ncbi:MAG: hypothetical protein CMJ65_16645 [Planctomycetaceae bacterium]|jgi:hypothetical protein|nr:hypothetical protein [Planctomycetaceae bacterium]MDP7276344.1 DUF1501 domain-containing protein [Planctomycetaceae bacterium]